MWGDLFEKGKQLASKAQAAALEIDKQINQSVGIVDAPAPAPGLVDEHDDDDDILNDAWDGDNDDLAGLDDEDEQKPAPEPYIQSDVATSDELSGEVSEFPATDNITQNDHDDDTVHGNTDTDAIDEIEIKQTVTNQEKDEAQISETSDSPNDGDGEVLTKPEEPVESLLIMSESEHIGIDHIPIEAQKSDNYDSLHNEAEDVPQGVEEEAFDVGNVDPDMIDNINSHDNQEKEVCVASSRDGESDIGTTKLPLVASVDNSMSTAIHESDEQNESTIEIHPLVEVPVSNLTESLSVQQESDVHREYSELFQSSDQNSKQDVHTSDASSTEKEKFLEAKLMELNNILRQREEQLMSKTEQLTEMTAMFESEKQQLQQKIVNVKEEAKRRTLKAKERVEAMELRMKEISRQSTTGEQDAAKQAELIAALREEGEKLAQKQAEMEKAVRTAKGEARRLREELEDEKSAKDIALAKIESLESELKTTKDNLSAARRGESQAEKLDTELRQLAEENNMKAAAILSLEQQVKELKEAAKEQEITLQEVQNGAAVETEREIKRMRKEHNDAISDLEAKLRTTEREAGIREDALRYEIAELRKRWQDSVRRADSLSMDIQSSTAPLLRQIESAERQNRTRAAAWAELESTLRSQLEEAVISNEQLLKEKSELKTRNMRNDRALKEHESEIKHLKYKLEETIQLNQELQNTVDELEIKNAKMKEEYSEVQRIANEGVSKVRSEMSQTIMENEERYQAQIESVRKELGQEREKRSLLEKQVGELVDKAGMIIPPQLAHSTSLKSESKPARLRQSEKQIDILSDAVGGLGSDDEEDEEYEEEHTNRSDNAHESLAALAELTSRLKAAKFELDVLQKQLAESECARDRMAAELNEARGAKEKLPSLEKTVQDLTRDNEEMAVEIRSLQEDIAEVKEMYRSQLNALLEEKAARNKELIPPSEPIIGES